MIENVRRGREDVRGAPTILAGPGTLREIAGRLDAAVRGNLTRCRNRLDSSAGLRPCIGCHCGAVQMAGECEQLQRLATVLDTIRLAVRPEAPANALVEGISELVLGMTTIEPDTQVEPVRKLELA